MLNAGENVVTLGIYSVLMSAAVLFLAGEPLSEYIHKSMMDEAAVPSLLETFERSCTGHAEWTKGLNALFEKNAQASGESPIILPVDDCKAIIAAAKAKKSTFTVTSAPRQP